MRIETYSAVNAQRNGLVNKKIRPRSDKWVDVTIGICVKNNEKTIKQAVLSVLDQTFPHDRMEIIVVDDSTDRTPLIVRALLSKADIQWQLYSTNGNGLGAARQVVVNNARGDFIVWVDGDTILSRNFIREQVDIMSENPLIGFSAGKLKSKLSGSVVAKLEVLSNSHDFDFGTDKEDYKRLGGCGTYRLAALRKVGGFDNKIRGAGEDADVTGRIKSAGYLLFQSQSELENIFGQTWKDLLHQCAWYGYGIHYLYHKNKHLVYFKIYFLPVSFARGIIRLIIAFKATHKWICFLLPFFYVFKTTAWWWGFLRAHREGYGNNVR